MLLSGLVFVGPPLRAQLEDLKLQTFAQVGKFFACFADHSFGVEGLMVALSPNKVAGDHPESQKKDSTDREVGPTARLPVGRRKTGRGGKLRQQKDLGGEIVHGRDLS